MKRICLALYCFFILNGCSQSTNEDITKLNVQISELQTQITQLQNRVTNLSNDMFSLQNPEAVFTPSAKGYAVVRTNVGSFVAALNHLTSYADGYQAVFSIGNPNLITFDGVKAIVRWGKPYSSDQNFFEWYKSLKVQEIEINKPLLPGVWNNISVVLSPAEAKETGFISLSLQVNKVYLYKDFRKSGG